MPVGEVMSARGHMWLGFASNVGWGILFLGANAWFAGWAAFGLASARLLAYAVHGVFVLGYTIVFINAQRPRGEDRVAMLGEA
jgi:hypothetical protein